ncbi:MAG: type II toxin-antitoxin system HicA family toxin [Synergistaceae bacterium]|nr:type II toxin-antitoxin system HicA family toxin [Synergistaceae bacterium]
MGRIDKLLDRLLAHPSDFTFDEARVLLEAYGYVFSNSGKTSGSRVKFYRGTKIFRMHKPHPRKILLEYQVKELIAELKEEGII